MGYRLHYASKYDIKYDGVYFNWKYTDFNRFAENHFAHTWFNNEDIEEADELEIEREEIVKFIEHYKDKPEELKAIQAKYGRLDTYEPDDFLSVLKEIAEQSDPNNESIHIAWF